MSRNMRQSRLHKVLRMLISWLQVHPNNQRQLKLSPHNQPKAISLHLRRTSLPYLPKLFCRNISNLYTSHLPQNLSSHSPYQSLLPPPSHKFPRRSRLSTYLPPSLLASPRTSTNPPPRKTNLQIQRVCCLPRARNLKRRNGMGDLLLLKVTRKSWKG